MRKLIEVSDLYHAFASSLQNDTDPLQACSPAALMSEIISAPLATAKAQGIVRKTLTEDEVLLACRMVSYGWRLMASGSCGRNRQEIVADHSVAWQLIRTFGQKNNTPALAECISVHHCTLNRTMVYGNAFWRLLMYAVTGATDIWAKRLSKACSSRYPADKIVALVRDPAKASALGVQARAADYFVPASLEESLAGVDTLLLISSSSMEDRAQQHINVVNAAKKAGVKHIIYTSLLHADRWTHWFAADHTATEAAIKASALNYTILRNGWYWENHTVAIAPSLAHGALIGSAGEALVSWASRQDFADAAVTVMTTPGMMAKPMSLPATRAIRCRISRRKSHAKPASPMSTTT